MKRPSLRRHEDGNIILIVLAVLAILMVIVAAATQYTGTINRHVQRSNTHAGALAMADGCIDVLFSGWRQKAAGLVTPTTNDLQTIALPTQAMFPEIPNFTASRTSGSATVTNYQVMAVDPELNPIGATATVPPSVGQDSGHNLYSYLATAEVTLQTASGPVSARVQRVFQKEVISPWNFAIFFIDDLEIHPGPQFNVSGWVHTNASLYTGSNTLNFLDKVTYGQDWVIGFKPGDSAHTNTPTSPTWLSNLPPAQETTKEPFGWDPTVFNTSDSNQDNDGYREIIERPVNHATDPLAGQRFYDQATVVVEITGSNDVEVYKRQLRLPPLLHRWVQAARAPKTGRFIR